MKIQAVCFDMDGTLIRNTDSVRYLCELNGNLEPLKEIEDREKEGTITWIEADHLKVRLIEELDLARVESEFERCIDLIHSIESVLAYLKARHISAVLITAGPTQVANVLGTRFGFDSVYGSRYETTGTEFTGRITHYLGSSGKLSCLQDFCAMNGISVGDCVAIGDSGTDIDVFMACGRSIALNGTDAAVEAASASLVTNDLADILELLRSWISD
jgi:phosphoserine phosphatase